MVAVAIDIDGTLLSNSEFELEVTTYIVERLSESLGIAVKEAERLWERELASTRSSPDWFKYDFHCRRLGMGHVAEGAHEHARSLLVPFQGAEDTLRTLVQQGRTVVAVTDAENWVARLKLKATGLLPYFSSIFTSADVGAPKAMPQYWKALLQQLNVGHREDHIVDNRQQNLEAARSAGIRARLVLFDGSEHVTELGPHLSPHITDLSQPTFLRAIDHRSLCQLILGGCVERPRDLSR